MHFPSFIRDPAVAIVGEKCYTSLVENLNIHDTECIKYAISKGLGLGIVLGGSIVKIPQILTIFKNQSTQGLSLSSFLLETLSYLIVCSYNLRQGNPLSTFGELLLICIQNMVIVGLIFYFQRQAGMMVAVWIGLAGLFYYLNDTGLVPSTVMNTLYAATIPISLSSKVPQIWSNFKNKSTGQLSVFTVVNYFVGTAARVFTNMTEVGDPLMMLSGILATAFNGILLLQVALYWGKTSAQKKPVSKLD